jgi:hypothetical protein
MLQIARTNQRNAERAFAERAFTDHVKEHGCSA